MKTRRGKVVRRNICNKMNYCDQGNLDGDMKSENLRKSKYKRISILKLL